MKTLSTPTATIRTAMLTPELLRAAAQKPTPHEAEKRISAAGIVARSMLQQLAATEYGCFAFQPRQDKSGAPLPSNGLYWSLAHSGDRVAVALHTHPIGIDLETLIPRHPALLATVATEERRWLHPDPLLAFYEQWTAKEAVAKRLGIGIDAIAALRVIARERNTLTLSLVRQTFAVRILRESESCLAHTR